jgi:heme exporter protein D
MIWRSAGEFLSMGGYGLYVWGSYAMAAAVMLIEPAIAARRYRAAVSADDPQHFEDR